MRRYLHQRQLGYSLLELLLVVLVMTILVFFGLSQYQTYQRNQNLEALRHNIRTLFTAGNAFYRQQCQASNSQDDFTDHFSKDKFNINTVNAAFPLKLVKTHLVAGESNGDLNKGYELFTKLEGSQVKKGITFYQYHLALIVKLKPSLDANWYASALNAKIKDSHTLEWVVLPGFAEQQALQDFWIMDAGLSQFKQKAIENSAGQVLKQYQCAY